MSYTGKIKVTNSYGFPANVMIVHKSGLIGNQSFNTTNPIPRNTSSDFPGEFKSVQNYPVKDQFEILVHWNPGDDKFVRANATIKYSWNKNDDGKVVEIILGQNGVTFKPPSGPANFITQPYDSPIQ
jgi:hypothetical protein